MAQQLSDESKLMYSSDDVRGETRQRFILLEPVLIKGDLNVTPHKHILENEVSLLTAQDVLVWCPHIFGHIA